jgi:protein SCO1/2
MAENKGAVMAKWIWIGLFVLVAGVAAWMFTPNPANDTTSNTRNQMGNLVGGPFSLVNQDGERVTEKDFLGSYFLVYFGYSYCPDVCPVDLQSMTAALDLLNEETLDKVQPVFITIDPERDTVEVMKAYVSLFHPKLIGLTGTPEEITAATRAYRVYARKVETESDSDYLMDHSAITFLMSPEGKYIAHFSTGFKPEAMAQRLEDVVR